MKKREEKRAGEGNRVRRIERGSNKKVKKEKEERKKKGVNYKEERE